MALSPDIPVRADPAFGPARDGHGLPPWLRQTRDWRWLLLYLAVPALIGLYGALNNWAVLQLVGYQGTILFYAGHAFVPWWIAGVMSFLVFRALRPWAPHLIIVTTLGSALACLVTVPYANWLTSRFAGGWFSGDPDGLRATAHIMGQVGFWAFLLRASVSWTLVNLAFDRWLGLPRYRYSGATDATGPASVAKAAAESVLATAPDTDAALLADAGEVRPGTSGEAHSTGPQRLLQRLPVAVSAVQVLAIKAEQHYVKVYTPDRSFMTLYRFSDAMAEMDAAAGSQIHRSWWVRNDAIRRIRRDGRKYLLELSNGLVVPISAANRGAVLALARRANVPAPPAS